MIGECRRSLNSFDVEIDMAIFVGREDTDTDTDSRSKLKWPSLSYMLLFGTR